MQKEEQDLRDRTKAFALQIVRMFSALPKTTEAQVLRTSLGFGSWDLELRPRKRCAGHEPVIFVVILKRAKISYFCLHPSSFPNSVGSFRVGLLLMIAVSAGAFACILALPAHSRQGAQELGAAE